MSAVAVIRAKLAAYASLTAIIPAEQIKAGLLPLDTRPPAIGVTLVNGNVMTVVSQPASGRMRTDIVRVSVLVPGEQTSTAGTGYLGLRTILAHVLAACPKTRGTVAGVSVDSIIPGSEGPDIPTDAPNWLSGSRDFTVRWTD